MPKFFVENANFDAAVSHLLEHGRFDEKPTRSVVEQLLKSNLSSFYPDTLPGNPEDHCECVYQSVFCMPCAAPEQGPGAYLLNLVCRLRSTHSRDVTRI